jgi:hypothetical protein
VKYLSFHNSSSFCLNIIFNVNGKATHPLWHTPCFGLLENHQFLSVSRKLLLNMKVLKTQVKGVSVVPKGIGLIK